MFCDNTFARIIFENDTDRQVYWLDIRNYKGWLTGYSLHEMYKGLYYQIGYHPKIKQLHDVDDWMKTNNIIWPFNEDERVLFLLTFG